MQADEIDRLDRIEASLESNTQAIEHLGEQVASLVTSVAELKDDLKGWTTWLRSATTIILFSVALTLIGLVLPIAIGLGDSLLSRSILTSSRSITEAASRLPPSTTFREIYLQLGW